MRWERLFADLEAQLEAAGMAQRRAAVAEATRAERATVRLSDRVRASVGHRLRVELADPATRPEGVVEGVVVDAAVEWFLLDVDGGRQGLVPLSAVRQVRGLASFAAPPAGAVERRLGLGHTLRALARDRATVQVVTGSGPVVGVLAAVGADHADVVDRPGAPPISVPFAAMLVVLSR